MVNIGVGDETCTLNIISIAHQSDNKKEMASGYENITRAYALGPYARDNTSLGCSLIHSLIIPPGYKRCLMKEFSSSKAVYAANIVDTTKRNVTQQKKNLHLL
jgi:hypothetical protein